MADNDDFGLVEGDLPDALDKVKSGTQALGFSAATFANAMTRAFAQAASGGKQFDDVLKQVALRLSGMAVTQAFKSLFSTAGSAIATPTYFPTSSGGFGFSGDGGAEPMIAPMGGADAMFGGALSAGAPANISVQIATPDPSSFRRSEAYITGQIARAVARGQRGM